MIYVSNRGLLEGVGEGGGGNETLTNQTHEFYYLIVLFGYIYKYSEINIHIITHNFKHSSIYFSKHIFHKLYMYKHY